MIVSNKTTAFISAASAAGAALESTAATLFAPSISAAYATATAALATPAVAFGRYFDHAFRYK